jgi:hypothetical protein
MTRIVVSTVSFSLARLRITSTERVTDVDLTTLTYLNSLVIIVALVIMAVILYAIRREQAELLLRIGERSNTIAVQTAAALAIAQEILRQVKK